MTGIMPPPVFQKPKRWGDCQDLKSEDQFYEEFGFETGYRLGRLGQRLFAVAVAVAAWPLAIWRIRLRRRSRRRLTNCPSGS